MGTIAVAEANKILAAWTGQGTYTASAAVYAKLHLGDPGVAGATSPASNTTRQAVTFGSAASAGAIASTADTTWTATTGETYAWVSFWDASTGGNFLGRDDLSATAAVLTSETFSILSGGMTMTLTGTAMAVGEQNKALDAWAGRATYTASAGFFVKLHTADPGVSGTTAPATDTTRKAVTFGTAASAGAVASTVAIAWTGLAGPTAPTTESIAWFSFFSAVTAGTFLGRDDLATSRAISSGDGLTVAIAGVALTAT